MISVKEYLGQAYRIDQRINSKIEQISTLNALATKATSVITDMPRPATRNVHRMEDVISKIIDLQNEINNDIDILVDLKTDIMFSIKEIDNLEYQTLLELRYLCYKSWEQIAIDMGYSINNIFKMHRKALEVMRVPDKDPYNLIF